MKRILSASTCVKTPGLHLFGASLLETGASLVAQMVKNLPVVRENWVCSLSWEDPLEEGMTTHSSILAWRILMDRGAWRTSVHWVTKSWTQLNN